MRCAYCGEPMNLASSTMYAGKLVHKRCAFEFDAEIHADQQGAADDADYRGYCGDRGVRTVAAPADFDEGFEEGEVDRELAF